MTATSSNHNKYLEPPFELQDYIVACDNTYTLHSLSDSSHKIGFIQVLKYYTEEYGIALTDSMCEDIYKHYELLTEKNKLINLTRITEPLNACILHYVDSLLISKACPDNWENTHFLDIGCGAGFPGIPLGIYTQAQGTLIDSVGKKVNCVNEFIDELKLDNLHALHMRAEELALKKPHSYDMVVCRAVAPLRTLIEYASPLLKKNGVLICAKSNKADKELLESAHAQSVCGMTYVSRETYELPLGFGYREILSFKKTKTATIKLPRNIGMAQHKPL